MVDDVFDLKKTLYPVPTTVAAAAAGSSAVATTYRWEDNSSGRARRPAEVADNFGSLRDHVQIEHRKDFAVPPPPPPPPPPWGQKSDEWDQ